MSKNNGRGYLDQYLVTRFAKITALLKKWGDRREQIRQELLEGLHDGKNCPRSGPFLVVLTAGTESRVDWRREWEHLAREHYGRTWTKEQDRLFKEYERETEKLLVQPNPDFRLEEPDKPEHRSVRR